MSTPYPLSASLRASIADLQADLAELQAALEAVTGATEKIDYPYGELAVLDGRFRTILAALADLDDHRLVETIHTLRVAHRAVVRLIAAPERFLSTFEARAAAYRARGGSADLADLAGKRLKLWRVRAGDTPQSIAQAEMGNSARWPEIAILNGLGYPYIVDDPSYPTEAHATGYVTFSHPSVQGGDYLIPAGTILTTSPADGVVVRFATTEAATIPAGSLSVADVPVQAVDPGPEGNVAPGTITVVESLSTAKVSYSHTLSVQVRDAAGNLQTASRDFTHESWPSVTNPAATTGGARAQVATIGDLLALPVEQTAEQPTHVLQMPGEPDPERRLYGVDLGFDADGQLLPDATGDLVAVGGLANLAVAVRLHCETERGDLAGHPDYGSTLHDLVGQLEGPTLADEVRVAIREAALSDPRVSEVTVENVAFDGPVLELDVLYETDSVHDTGSLHLTFGPS